MVKEMKMRRVVILMLILVMTVQLFASCASTPQNEDPPKQDNADELTLETREDLYPEYEGYEKITVLEAGTEAEPNSVGYDVDLTDVADSELILAAADVSVLDCRFPVKVVFNYVFPEAGERSCVIKDFFGNDIFSTVISGKANETVNIELGIKDHPTGYFTVSCGDDEMPYVVTPPYDTRVSDSKFAMDAASYYILNDDLDLAYSVAGAARLAGVTWVRDRSHWEEYEPNKGEYDFSSTEGIFSVLNKAGLHNVPVLYHHPAWTYDGEHSMFVTSLIEAYKMAKELAIYYDDEIDAWELWNESDYIGTDMPECFSAWLKAVALGIGDSGTDTLAVSGGLCELSKIVPYPDYAALCLLNDIMDYADAFCYHNHTYSVSFPYPNFTSIAWATQATSLISLYNDTDRPVWMTEAGMKTNSITPERSELILQAPYVVTSTVQSFAAGTDKHFYFILPGHQEEGGDFGVFDDAYNPRPSLAAEAVMSYMLGDAELMGELIDIPSTMCGYLFDTGDKPTSVLWAIYEDMEYTFESDTAVIVTDMMGGQTLVRPTDGKITVGVTTEPIYITYSKAPERIYERGWEERNVEKKEYSVGEHIIITPDFETYTLDSGSTRITGYSVYDGVKIDVRVTNLNDIAVTGKLNIDAEGITFAGLDTEITIEPLSEVIVPLTVEKLEDPTLNDHITFDGVFNGEETSATVVHIAGPEARSVGDAKFDNIFVGTLPADILSNIVVNLPDVEGEPVVMLDDKVVDTYTFEPGKLTIDLSGIGSGKYVLTAGIRTRSGFCYFDNLTMTYDGTTLSFGN